ncbi:ApbE family protein [uncultured archaeon]|nr:ApbE family protein [uncultured archaeon]
MDVSLERPLLGGKINFIAYDCPEQIALPVLDEAYTLGKKLEEVFSLYSSTSELSKLNKKRTLPVSEDLLFVISKALEYCKLTKGEYDISLGKKIIARKKGEEIEVSCSYKDISINGNKISLLNPDVLIDLGSIAKGFIVDKLVSFLKEKGIKNGLVNARGDLRVFGDIEQPMGIQHPRGKEKIIHSFILKNQAVATSGDYNQFIKKYDQSHILNKKDLISATVLANTTMEADVLTSVVFLLDEKSREDFLKKNKTLRVFAVNKELKIKKYNNFP